MPGLKKARRVTKGGRQALIALAGNPGGPYTTAGPKGGTTTRKSSGKADTFEGPGPAPSGTTKVPEKDYTEVPTVTVGPTGNVSTSGFGSDGAAKRAVRQQEASERRVRRIVRSVAQTAQKRSQRKVEPPKPYEAPKVPVTSYKRSLPGPTNVKKTVPVEDHSRAIPQKFEGKPTAGTPNRGELELAKRTGTLKTNKAGALTTPKVRKASRAVQKARKAVAKTKPQITGLHTKPQEEFAEYLSKFSKIPPKLAGEWTLQESGGATAGVGGEAGRQNQLGVRYPGEPTPFSQTHFLGTPKRAAKETTLWMEGKLGRGTPDEAAPSIQGIPQLAKSGASEEQIRSYIEGPSQWGTGHIAQTGVQVVSKGKSNPKAAKQLKAAVQHAEKLGLHPGKGAGDVASAGEKYVKVRADAKGAVKWAESALGQTEGSPKTMKWGAQFGLNPVTQPWCANFISNDLLRRGITNLPSNPNYVPSYEEEWGKYAVPASQIKPGDLVTFSGSHIGLYVGNGEMISGNS